MVSRLESVLIWYARRCPVSRGKMRMVDTLWSAAVGDSGTQRVAHLVYGGYNAPCDIKEMLQRQLYFFGTYYLERNLLECWSELARQARIVFDVGANAGIYSLAALAANPVSIVHAFEPTPEIATRLRATAATNNLVQLQVHELAVLDHVCMAALNRCRGENDSNEGMNFVTAGAGGSSEMVEGTSLDHFCSSREIAYVDLIKLDIQGQESAALKGAQSLLDRQAISTIFMELNWAAGKSAHCPATEAVELLHAHGFLFAEPGLQLCWRTAGPWLRNLTDVVAQRAEACRHGLGSSR